MSKATCNKPYYQCSDTSEKHRATYLHPCYLKNCDKRNDAFHNSKFSHENNLFKNLWNTFKETIFQDSEGVVITPMSKKERCAYGQGCTKLNDREHKEQFYHVCPYASCKYMTDKGFDPVHFERYVHVCPYGPNCQAQQEKSHCIHFHHNFRASSTSGSTSGHAESKQQHLWEQQQQQQQYAMSVTRAIATEYQQESAATKSNTDPTYKVFIDNTQIELVTPERQLKPPSEGVTIVISNHMQTKIHLDEQRPIIYMTFGQGEPTEYAKAAQHVVQLLQSKFSMKRHVVLIVEDEYNGNNPLLPLIIENKKEMGLLSITIQASYDQWELFKGIIRYSASTATSSSPAYSQQPIVSPQPTSSAVTSYGHYTPQQQYQQQQQQQQPQKIASIFVEDKIPFKIMSYNILAQSYMSTERYPYVDKKFYHETRRMNRVVVIVKYHEPDVLCLQEVEPRVFEMLKRELSDYEGCYAKKEGGKKDGVATFVKKDTFILVKSEPVKPLGGEKTETALLVQLKTNETYSGTNHQLRKPKDIMIANTHLYGHPEGSHTRVKQVTHVVEELARIIGQISIPCFICGDFNCSPGSAAYELLQTSTVHNGYPEYNKYPFKGPTTTIPFTFKSTVATYFQNNKTMVSQYQLDPVLEPAFTFKTNQICKAMDYIWYCNGKNLQVTEVHNTWSELNEPIPNKEHPSDHVPIIATFVFLQ